MRFLLQVRGGAEAGQEREGEVWLPAVGAEDKGDVASKYII